MNFVIRTKASPANKDCTQGARRKASTDCVDRIARYIEHIESFIGYRVVRVAYLVIGSW